MLFLLSKYLFSPFYLTTLILYYTKDKIEDTFISVSNHALPSVFHTFKKGTNKLILNKQSSCFVKQRVPTYPQRPLYSNIPRFNIMAKSKEESIGKIDDQNNIIHTSLASLTVWICEDF